MRPIDIAIGLLLALVRAAVIELRYLTLALLLSVAALAGCAVDQQPPLHTDGPRPIATPRPATTSLYEAGRRDALEQLRSLDVWQAPSRVCPDKVSWVDPKRGLPSWESRTENLELLDACRNDSLHNAILLNRQRQALEKAR